MKKLLTLVSIIVVLGLVSSIAFAKPYKEPVDSITLIHYIDGRVKLVGGGSCSKLLGVKWETLPVSYVINPGTYNQNFVTGAITAATKTWDDATTSTSLFDGYTPDYSATWGNQDGKNAYVFGSYSSGVIAVTTYWYYRNSKHFVEYDVLFNTYYNWYDCKKTPELCTVNNKAMDLQTIALHETGHGIGLADVYQKACGGVVMYGYGSYGEVRRTLAQPDIAGLQMLYGV
jgi:hypothetical protein